MARPVLVPLQGFNLHHIIYSRGIKKQNNLVNLTTQKCKSIQFILALGGGEWWNVCSIMYFLAYLRHCRFALCSLSIYLSIGINVRFAAMMADVGDGLL